MRRARSSAACNCSSREVNTFLIFSKLRSASSNRAWTRFSTAEIHLPRNALSSNHSKSIRFRSSDMLRRQQLPDNSLIRVVSFPSYTDAGRVSSARPGLFQVLDKHKRKAKRFFGTVLLLLVLLLLLLLLLQRVWSLVIFFLDT